MQNLTPQTKPVTHSVDHPDEAMDAAVRAKKVLIRRPGMVRGQWPLLDVRRAQTWRYAVQAGFALLNVYLGVLFYVWVRHYETGAQGLNIARPNGVEGWLPIAGLMNLKYTLMTWQIPPVHAAAMFLLVAFLLVSILLKKAFCSWLCPIGTMSEVLWKTGKRIFGRNYNLPRWLDIPLRALKYALLGVFVYVVVTMSAREIAAFMTMPYGLIADVKMLNFFRYMGGTALAVMAVLIVGSIFIPNLWCRYLCPYGALMGVASLFSLFKIRRDANACIDCGKCAKVCPAQLPMDKKLQIRSAECTACMSCVDICPAQTALQFSLPPGSTVAGNDDAQGLAQRWRRRCFSGGAVALMLVIIVGGVIGGAKWAGHWQTQIPERMYRVLITNAQSLPHP